MKYLLYPMLGAGITLALWNAVVYYKPTIQERDGKLMLERSYISARHTISVLDEIYCDDKWCVMVPGSPACAVATWHDACAQSE